MRTRKEAHRDSREHHEKMAEHPPDNKALTWFRRPAGVVEMIQAQAAQMEHKTVAEYMAEKYDIKGSVADGQEHT